MHEHRTKEEIAMKDIPFRLRCTNCGSYSDPEKSIYFIKGSKIIHDRLVYTCIYCGNNHESIIVWPLNLHGG